MKVENDKMPAGQHAPHGAAAAASVPLLAANAEGIVRSCETLDRAVRAGIDLPPAGARLLDGYHLLDTQLRLARAQSRQIAAQDGAARAWGLALDAVARADGVVDIEELARVLAAGQEGAPLRVAELDALPALLRLALIA
ncbi:hypothetical protein, partial [Massilia timonae]|uniref:hypothetical protein n=1 Tax=Massilia timonae TaxID=47229 RepID=UPI0028D6F8C7